MREIMFDVELIHFGICENDPLISESDPIRNTRQKYIATRFLHFPYPSALVDSTRAQGFSDLSVERPGREAPPPPAAPPPPRRPPAGGSVAAGDAAPSAGRPVPPPARPGLPAGPGAPPSADGCTSRGRREPGLWSETETRGNVEQRLRQTRKTNHQKYVSLLLRH